MYPSIYLFVQSLKYLWAPSQANKFYNHAVHKLKFWGGLFLHKINFKPEAGKLSCDTAAPTMAHQTDQTATS